MKESTHHSNVYILHKRNYRESSLILDLLTEESMRLSAVLRGARSRRKLPIDLLTKFSISWRGSGSLVTIISVEQVQQFVIQGKPLFAMMYINELLMRTIKDRDVVDGVFADYEAVLSKLQCHKSDIHSILRSFERTLLCGLGFEMVFDTSTDGKPIEPQGMYQLYPENGFKCVPLDHDDAIPGSTLLAINANDYSLMETRRLAKRLLQDSFKRHFGSSGFKSRELFKQAFVG